MTQELASAVDTIVEQQIASGKPLAIILGGHSGSGKSSMWCEHLADKLFFVGLGHVGLSMARVATRKANGGQ
jgi:predicted ABC-type ATPase